MRPAVTATFALLATIGLALRFFADSALWLDEAQTVAIVDAGVGNLASELRSDGHPPAYYVLLSVWRSVVGEGDAALRALSGVLSVGAALAVWSLVRTRHGVRAAHAATLLVACNPFLIRYGSEVRMYSLLAAAVLATWWAADRLRRTGEWHWFVLTAALTSLTLLTHYWALFTGLAAGLGALAVARRRIDHSGRVAAALAVGALGFAPWLPVFLEQLEHTGTPWATTPTPPSIALSVVADLGGGRQDNLAVLLAALLVTLFVLGITVRSAERWTVTLDFRIASATREWAWIGIGTLAIGSAVVLVTRGAFASRYAAGVAILLIALMGVGAASLRPRWIGDLALIAIATLGLVVAWNEASTPRTQADEIAAAIDSGPNDIVIACPDQLGPALQRALGPIDAISYPTLDPADRVIWTDYESRNTTADPILIADELIRRVGDGRIWFVTRGGYRTFGADCDRLQNELAARLGTAVLVVPDDENVFEPARLVVLSAAQ